MGAGGPAMYNGAITCRLPQRPFFSPNPLPRAMSPEPYLCVIAQQATDMPLHLGNVRGGDTGDTLQVRMARPVPDTTANRRQKPRGSAPAALSSSASGSSSSRCCASARLQWEGGASAGLAAPPFSCLLADEGEGGDAHQVQEVVRQLCVWGNVDRGRGE